MGSGSYVKKSHKDGQKTASGEPWGSLRPSCDLEAKTDQFSCVFCVIWAKHMAPRQTPKTVRPGDPKIPKTFGWGHQHLAIALSMVLGCFRGILTYSRAAVAAGSWPHRRSRPATLRLRLIGGWLRPVRVGFGRLGCGSGRRPW